MTPKACWSIAALVVAQVVVIATTAHAGITAVPVPEPATLTLLGVGAAVAAVGAWWRHRK